MADKTLSFSELERRNRATARAQAIWCAAVAILTVQRWTFGECIHEAEKHWEALHGRCERAEPAVDETEFGLGMGNTQGHSESIGA